MSYKRIAREWLEKHFDSVFDEGDLDDLECLMEGCRLDTSEQEKSLQEEVNELRDLLVSAHAIAKRHGENTAWKRWSERLTNAGIGHVTAKVFKVLPSDEEVIKSHQMYAAPDNTRYWEHPELEESPCLDCSKDVVPVMVKVRGNLAAEGVDTWKIKHIDKCVAPIVKALQEGGIDMLSSCCGHGLNVGAITLADGRELLLVKDLV